jgi:hypothetical protein
MSFKDFLFQLDEMSMKAGDLEADLKRIFDHYSKNVDFDKAEHFGDIENVKVMRSVYGQNGIDFFVKGEERVGICIWSRFKIKIGEIFEISDVYVIPSERNKDLYYKYLYFLKNVDHQKILIGTFLSQIQLSRLS